MTVQPDDALNAAAYDRWFDSRWGRYAFAIERDALLGALSPLDGQRLADVGCGTGRFTAAFEAAGAQMTGIDTDPGMLALARRRTGAPLMQGDGQALPLPDHGFDVAVAVTLLEFADRAEQIIDELIRVTRRGGRIAVATLNPRSKAHRFWRTCARWRLSFTGSRGGRGPRCLRGTSLLLPG
jgi:ubiquinone/menaquinone biosynthesis C-methylase UbiE